MSDNVFNPQHYNMGKYETIDVIEDIIRFYSNPVHAAMVFQVIKYLARAPHKGKYKEDIQKANWYLNHLEYSLHDLIPFKTDDESPECSESVNHINRCADCGCYNAKENYCRVFKHQMPMDGYCRSVGSDGKE